MQQIIPFLTFKDHAEEAVNFYVSVFPNSKIQSMVRYRGEGPLENGALLNATFQLNGREFMAMDGGAHFKFDQGFSILVNCETQEEIDQLWEKFSQGGEKQMCGWVKDKYGVSWQIVPSILAELMSDKDPAKSKRVMEVLMKMDKLDIKKLKQAYEG